MIQYIGLIIGYANTVLLFPKILTSDEFGLTRILLSVAIVISQFAQIGSPAMVVRFYPYLKKKILYLGFLICSVGLLIVFGVLAIFKDQIIAIYEVESALFVDYFYLLIPFSIAMVYYNLFDAYLKAIYKNVVSASFPFVFLRVLWMILILMFASGRIDFDQFILGYSTAYILIALAALLYIAALKAFPDSLHFEDDEKDSISRILKFNSYNILSGLSSFMINRVDVLMLSAMEGLTPVGVYAIAFAMASVIRIPTSSIARVAPSLVAEAFKAGDMDQIATLYRKSSINQLILSLGAFLLILLNMNILLMFLDDIYQESFVIFVFLGLAQVVDTGVGINGHIMVNSPYYKTDAYLSIALLIVTLITNYIFIPMYGAVGAAIATLISILLYNTARWSFLKFRMGISPFSGKTLETLLIFGLAGALAWFIPTLDNVWLAAVQRTMIFLAISVPLTLSRNLSPDITELIQLFRDRITK
jgi:O-antigen/teichoic acid export membrane protein